MPVVKTYTAEHLHDLVSHRQSILEAGRVQATTEPVQTKAKAKGKAKTTEPEPTEAVEPVETADPASAE